MWTRPASWMSALQVPCWQACSASVSSRYQTWYTGITAARAGLYRPGFWQSGCSMRNTVGAFFSLYLATLVLLTGSGLFNTYMGLRLTAQSVSESWVGALIAIYYLGLVFGARQGHKLIIGVGHIRAYAASAAFVTVAILLQILVDSLWVWLALRFLAGLAMVTQFMVIESWLNEQTENHNRGVVFAFYMLVSGLGTVLGQLSLTAFPRLDFEPLVFVSMCFVLSLVPVTLTRRIHPALQVPAPLALRYFVAKVPMSIATLFVAGLMTGSFYGLAPVYALKQGLSNSQAALFVAAAVAAGLASQWPLGWLADRINRVSMIRVNALVLLFVALPLWGWFQFPFWVLVLLAALLGMLQFTLYPLATAFANDNVEPERRVGLSAVGYIVYGLGACVGPFVAGFLMRHFASGVYFVFVSVCAVVVIVFVRPRKVKGDHVSEDAPTEFVPMYDSLQTSNVAAVLDPRVDTDIDISHESPEDPEFMAEIDAAKAGHDSTDDTSDSPAGDTTPPSSGTVPEGADTTAPSNDTVPPSEKGKS